MVCLSGNLPHRSRQLTWTTKFFSPLWNCNAVTVPRLDLCLKYFSIMQRFERCTRCLVTIQSAACPLLNKIDSSSVLYARKQIKIITFRYPFLSTTTHCFQVDPTQNKHNNYKINLVLENMYWLIRQIVTLAQLRLSLGGMWAEDGWHIAVAGFRWDHPEMVSSAITGPLCQMPSIGAGRWEALGFHLESHSARGDLAVVGQPGTLHSKLVPFFCGSSWTIGHVLAVKNRGASGRAFLMATNHMYIHIFIHIY